MCCLRCTVFAKMTRDRWYTEQVSPSDSPPKLVEGVINLAFEHMDVSREDLFKFAMTEYPDGLDEILFMEKGELEQFWFGVEMAVGAIMCDMVPGGKPETRTKVRHLGRCIAKGLCVNLSSYKGAPGCSVASFFLKLKLPICLARGRCIG